MLDITFRNHVSKNCYDFKMQYVAAYLAGVAAIDCENSLMSAEQRLARVQDPDVEDAVFQAELAWNKLIDLLGGNI